MENGASSWPQERTGKSKTCFTNPPSADQTEEEDIESVGRTERTRRLINAAVKLWELRRHPWG